MKKLSFFAGFFHGSFDCVIEVHLRSLLPFIHLQFCSFVVQKVMDFSNHLAYRHASPIRDA